MKEIIRTTEICSKCGANRIIKISAEGMIVKIVSKLKGVKCKHVWPSNKDETN
jgi:ssDNA-binding Zn-finger/Zn-ribbon topoisomerase 1